MFIPDNYDFWPNNKIYIKNKNSDGHHPPLRGSSGADSGDAYSSFAIHAE